MNRQLPCCARIVVAFAFVALVAPAAFAQKKDAKPAAGGAATPEETFKLAQAAAEKGNWKGVVVHMTPESQEMFAGGLAFAGVMMQAFAELGGPEGAKEAQKIKAVLAKHGLTEAAMKKLEGDDSVKNPEEAIKKIVAPIKDRGAFIGDMMTAFKDTKGFKENDSPISKDAKLKDVKIDGNNAKGTVEFEKNGEKTEDPIAFKKVNGKWLLDLTEAMKKELGPGPGAGPLE